jgi:hypothetical protein
MRDPRDGAAARLDLDRPVAGLVLESHDAAPDHLLGVDARSPWALVDHWVRDGDVTAVYESTDARRLRITALWRLHPAGAATHAYMAVMSAQTALVQSDSLLAVVSDVEAESLAWGTLRSGVVHWDVVPRDVVPRDAVPWDAVPAPDATCVLLRRAGRDTRRPSILVAAHPGECRRLTARRDGARIAIDCWLFSSTLEKGVLLRSRILAAIGPAADDTAWAGSLATAFAAEPPFLST